MNNFKPILRPSYDDIDRKTGFSFVSTEKVFSSLLDHKTRNYILKLNIVIAFYMFLKCSKMRFSTTVLQKAFFQQTV